MRDGSQIETFDPGEIVRIGGIERKLVRNCRRRDHGAVGASLNLAAAFPERGCHSAERPSRIGIEGQRLEVGLGLLQHSLASCPLLTGGRYERTNRQLRQGDRGDDRLLGKVVRVEATEQNNGGRIEYPAIGHRRESMV